MCVSLGVFPRGPKASLCSRLNTRSADWRKSRQCGLTTAEFALAAGKLVAGLLDAPARNQGGIVLARLIEAGNTPGRAEALRAGASAGVLWRKLNAARGEEG